MIWRLRQIKPGLYQNMTQIYTCRTYLHCFYVVLEFGKAALLLTKSFFPQLELYTTPRMTNQRYNCPRQCSQKVRTRISIQHFQVTTTPFYHVVRFLECRNFNEHGASSSSIYIQISVRHFREQNSNNCKKNPQSKGTEKSAKIPGIYLVTCMYTTITSKFAKKKSERERERRIPPAP